MRRLFAPASGSGHCQAACQCSSCRSTCKESAFWCKRKVCHLVEATQGKGGGPVSADGKMTMELDVFVGNTSLIDEEVYQLWLDGYSVSDAVCRRSQSGILEQASATSDVLGSDTMDHYRTFQMLERLLHHPTKLVNQLLFQIPPHMQALLIEKFGNRDYAAIVFFANNRFETGKKKLQYLTFEDFAYCAEQMIQNWTLGAVDSMVDDMDVDLDKEFLQDLKDLKVLVTDKDLLDQHKSLVCTALRGKISNFTEMEASFKFANLYWPASGDAKLAGVPGAREGKTVQGSYFSLLHSGECVERQPGWDGWRGKIVVEKTVVCCVAVKMSIIYFTWVFFFFFPPLCECMKQFIEPCKSEKWTINDVRLFLTQYTNSARALDAFRYVRAMAFRVGVFQPTKSFHND
nr:PREDICTED: acidic fibroblast growth factor intracellular-binding protein [Latimeria chalumnae]|eukprot:XP_014345195.1 PREDICTED: acidic fibroblast growth factor intracellular-binding protein [Latimeria chalumnae]